MPTTSSIVRSTDVRILANRGENFLMESGLYDLIIRSRKAEARAFMSRAGSSGRLHPASGRTATLGMAGPCLKP
jgi:hypothetical protein